MSAIKDIMSVREVTNIYTQRKQKVAMEFVQYSTNNTLANFSE